MAEMSQGGFFLLYLLSSILQADAPEKYCLSPKACQGILRRAARRGKELPEVLRIALERQAARDEVQEASVQVRAAEAEATGTVKSARPQYAEANRPVLP